MEFRAKEVVEAEKDLFKRLEAMSDKDLSELGILLCTKNDFLDDLIKSPYWRKFVKLTTAHILLACIDNRRMNKIKDEN